MDTTRLTAQMTIELRDDTGKPVVWLSQSAFVGAMLPYDVLLNVERMASHVVNALGPKFAQACDGSLVVLDVADVQRRNVIGAYLRKLADELQGKSLYHPDSYLRGRADEIDPPLEVLRDRVAALAQANQAKGTE